jgi:hypothetical protein
MEQFNGVVARKKRLQERHKKQTNQLNMIDDSHLSKLDDTQMRSLMDRLLLGEGMSLRITRPLFIDKVKLVNSVLKSRGINLKEEAERK